MVPFIAIVLGAFEFHSRKFQTKLTHSAFLLIFHDFFQESLKVVLVFEENFGIIYLGLNKKRFTKVKHKKTSYMIKVIINEFHGKIGFSTDLATWFFLFCFRSLCQSPLILQTHTSTGFFVRSCRFG